MLDDLTQADILFLGERHTVSRHHEWQFKVVDALAAKGKKLVLGMEMMEKRFQPQLDQYVKALSILRNWRRRLNGVKIGVTTRL